MPPHTAPTAVDLGARLLGRPLEHDRVLTGGQHARTVMADDAGRRVVVRTFPRGDDAVQREVAVLTLLGPLGELAPSVLAHGEVDGVPTIVTTALPGAAPADGLDPMVIAEQMGAALARIHRIAPVGLPDESRAPTRHAGRLAARAREAWERTDRTRVLTHGDFWCGNAVWDGAVLTGIVDWSGAMSAPRGVDIAWCRQDLVLLGAPDAADRFLRSYEVHAGRLIDDVHAWDLIAASRADPYVETWEPNYLGIGQSGVTAPVIRSRFDAWVRHLLG